MKHPEKREILLDTADRVEEILGLSKTDPDVSRSHLEGTLHGRREVLDLIRKIAEVSDFYRILDQIKHRGGAQFAVEDTHYEVRAWLHDEGFGEEIYVRLEDVYLMAMGSLTLSSRSA